MNVPFIDLKRQYANLKSKILPVVEKSFENGSFIMGESVKNFENNVSKYLQNNHSLGCASGSDALLLSLMALGIKEGDEVITTPFTFFATIGAISRLNATPVFVDIDKDTFNLDLDKLEEKITSKTKAIIIVHLFGQSVNMDKLCKIAKENNIKLIEDACQSFGGEYNHKKLGNYGDFGCFSFFPTKNLGAAGDGGLITCKSKEDYELVKKLRLHGACKKYYHDLIGINSRLDAIQAEILNIKLDYIDDWNKRRIEIAKKYSSELSEFVKTPKTNSHSKHIFHQYAILTDKRDKLLDFLQNKGIAAGIYYPKPLHSQECFKHLNYIDKDFPITQKISKEILSLPIFPEMKDDEVEYVISCIKDFFQQ